MSDTAEPTQPLSEHFAADVTPRTAATRSPADAGKVKPFGDLGLRAAARAAATPKLTRVVCVAFLGMALGGVCGLWLRARMASASLLPTPSVRSVPAAQLLGNTPVTSSAVPEPTPDGYDPPASSPAAAPAPRAEVPLAEKVPETRAALKAAEGRGEGRAAIRGTEATAAGVASAPKALKGGGKSSPCAIYASANSLSLRSGGSAPLVLGGPGPFTVTTPDWSNVAVFLEGRTGGGKNGWTKYAVRSVGKRAGVYTLHVKSPCDSQTIRVRVTPL